MDFKIRLLEKLNIKENELDYFCHEPNVKYLEDYHNFLDIDKATYRILKAIKENEKIFIYGDYDADGISSVSILVKALKKLNANVGYYIPSRYIDGYGITTQRVKEAYDKGYKVIITVDNGVSMFESLSLAKEKGIDVILTDHHVYNEIPPCYAFIHPFHKENIKLEECGAYVAFSLATSLLGYIDDYLLSLAGFATISDQMPLTSYNRELVKLALKNINQNHYRQFDILLDKHEATSENIAFYVTPKVNAVGRIIKDTKVNRLVNYFVTENNNEIDSITNFINEVNDIRKKETEKAINSNLINKNDNIVFSIFNNTSEGLIGLLASKIASQTLKPTFIFCHDSKDPSILKCSGRSFSGFNLNEVINQVKPYLLTSGGHQLACGLSMKEENFNKCFEIVNNSARNVELTYISNPEIEVDYDEINYENYLLIKSLEPYGQGFPKPLICFDFNKDNVIYLSQNKHIKGMINSNASFIGFNYGNLIKNINSNVIKVIGAFELDNYYGKTNLSIKVRSIK